MRLASRMLLSEQALRGLAEEVKCPLCIDILKPPCARPACCHYLCSTCLTDLLRNRHECPICKGPLRRRDIRGDPRIDRIAKLVSQLQSLGELDPNGEVEYEPLQPMAQNAQPSRRNSGSQSKRKASGSTAAAHKFCGASNAEAAHSDAAAAELGAEAAPQRPQQQERPNAGQLAAEPVPWDTSRQSHAAYAFAAAGDGNGPPAAEDSAARPQEVRSFKRQKRQPKVDQPTLEPPKAEPPKPELPKTGQSKPEQPKATQTKAALQAQQLPARRPPKSAKQQLQDAARQHADTQGRRAPELKANNAAAAHPVALATAGNAASRSTAKHGSRRVSEPKVDPYEFHSSGSQPLAPQAVLVAPPGASTTGTADAAGPPALAGRPAARASGGAAKQARGAAPDQSAAGSAAASAHAGQSHSHSGRSQLSSQSAGRRIPGRLVPWSCGACTFENPASALKCEMCDTPRPKRHAQPAAEAQVPQPERSGRGAAAAKREPSAERSAAEPQPSKPQRAGRGPAPAKREASCTRKPSAERPAKRRGVSPAASGATPAHAETPGAEASASKKAARPGAGMVLVPSGMDADGKARLAAFAKGVGARLAPRNKYCDSVTHVVCGVVTRDGTPKRTLTVMLGILTGRWVVSASWLPPPGSTILDDEQEHEVKGGPALGRLSRIACGGQLLAGFEIHLAGNFGRRDDFARLVRAAGARLLSRPPVEGAAAAAKKPAVTTITLYDEDTCSWGKGERPRHVWHVSSKWLSDTAFAYTVAPLEEYIVDDR